MCTTACDPLPVYCRISCKIHTPQREGDGNFEWGSYNVPNVTFLFFFLFFYPGLVQLCFAGLPLRSWLDHWGTEVQGAFPTSIFVATTPGLEPR